MTAAPLPDSPVVPAALDGSKTIRFRCHRGIACWNACCSSIDLALTPVDIVRLKRRLGLRSGEFLAAYTLPYELEPGGITGVKLRPVEGGSACPFVRSDGCAVYADRPTACRYYPLALLSMRRQGESRERDAYALLREPHCLGHGAQRTLTIDAYRAEQGAVEADELARGWRQLILKKKSSGPTIGKPGARSLQLWFMACYDVDALRAFVAGDGFQALFELPSAELDAILADDYAAMRFGFRLLRQVLFGEQTIALRADAAARRRERVRAHRAELELEAAAQRADERFDEDAP